MELFTFCMEFPYCIAWVDGTDSFEHMLDEDDAADILLVISTWVKVHKLSKYVYKK